MQTVKWRVCLDSKERLTAFLNRAEEQSEGFVLIAQRSPGRRRKSFGGLDQINLRLPRALIGRGEVDVALTVDGKAANGVRINIR